MNILIVGTGYVGTTTALVFAEMGWKVTGLDTDERKVELLRKGSLHFFEQGLEELLAKHLQEGNITFTAESKQAIEEHNVIFICVGTPSQSDGSANLQYVRQVSENIGRYMNEYKLIVNKSTVPVGTQEMVTNWIGSTQTEPHPYDVASNPEFLREGNALADALEPDRVIIGTSSARATGILQLLYKTMNCPIMITEPKTAELIKYAANAFLATKISYMNELARLCDKIGINIMDVSRGIGLDHRIGLSFLQAGIGYGGSCFPKDVAALLQTANQYGMNLSILEKVTAINQTQYRYLLDKVRHKLGNLHHKKVAILGLSFKPGTDDTREAPSIRLIQSLLDERAYVTVHDPIAKLPSHFNSASLKQCLSEKQAIRGADAVILCTDWPQYKQIDWMDMKRIMNNPQLFDGRNMLDAQQMTTIGFDCQGIGYQ